MKAAGPSSVRCPSALHLSGVLGLLALLPTCASGSGTSSGGVGAAGQADEDGISITIGTARERNVTQLDRTRVPELGRIRDPGLPTPDTFRLSNGIEVVFVRRRRAPLVAIEVVVRGGASTTRPDELGLAVLTAEALEEGSGSRSAFEFAEAVEAIGGRLSATASYDAFYIEGSAPSTRLDRLVELVADATLRPRFNETDVSRLRELQRARAIQRVDDPADLADDAFQNVVFGADPYGAPLIGTAESLASFDTRAVREFYGQHFSPERTTVLVVGDTQREDIEPVLEAAFGSWSSSRTLRALPGPIRSTGSLPQIHIVDKPGAAQSEIRIGRIGVLPSDSEIPAIDVLNTVLGGSFTSRLNSKLREDKGITYGASSVFADNVRTGPFSAETAVDTPFTSEAVADILAEFERLRTEPVSADELVRAKNYVALRLPTLFETSAELLDVLGGFVLYGQPWNWYDTYVEKVMAVSSSDVQAAADRYLDTGQVVIVVAGDEGRIATDLRALGRVIVSRPR